MTQKLIENDYYKLVVDMNNEIHILHSTDSIPPKHIKLRTTYDTIEEAELVTTVHYVLGNVLLFTQCFEKFDMWVDVKYALTMDGLNCEGMSNIEICDFLINAVMVADKHTPTFISTTNTIKRESNVDELLRYLLSYIRLNHCC